MSLVHTTTFDNTYNINNHKQWKNGGTYHYGPPIVVIDNLHLLAATKLDRKKVFYGVQNMSDVNDSQGIIIPWGGGITPLLATSLKIPYEFFLQNLHQSSQLGQDGATQIDVHLLLVEEEDTMVIRKYKRRKDKIKRMSLSIGEIPLEQFIVRRSLLLKKECTPSIVGRVFHKVLVSKSGQLGSSHWILKAQLDTNACQADSFYWSDGKSFFDTSTSHLRGIQNTVDPRQHVAIGKWIDHHTWTPTLQHLWKEN